MIGRSRLWLWAALALLAGQPGEIGPAASAAQAEGEAEAAATRPAEPPGQERREQPLSEVPRPAEVEKRATPSAPSPAQAAALEQARLAIEDELATEGVMQTLRALRDSGVATFELFHLIARGSLMRGDFDAASDAIERALEFSPDDADANVLYAGLLARAGKAADAIAHLHAAARAGEREPNNVTVTWAWFQLGVVLEAEGYLRAAEQAYAQFDRAIWTTHSEHRNAERVADLLERQPLGATTLRLQLLEKLGDTAGAERLSAWMVEHWPDDVQVARLRARTLLEGGQAPAALAFCEPWIARREQAGALLEVAIEAARAAGAVAAFVDGLQLADADAETQRFAALVVRRLVDAGELAAAERLGARLLAARPDSLGTAWDLAEVQLRAGSAGAALRTLGEAFARQPELEMVPGTRLRAWQRRVAELEQPAAALEAAEQDGPASFGRDFALAISWQGVDAGRAAGLLERVQAAQPRFLAARIAPIQRLLAEYRWEAALAAAEPLAREFDQAAAPQFLMGLAFDGLDRNEEAAAAFKSAVRIGREVVEYRLATARHYRRLDLPGSAERFYVEALALDSSNDEAFEGLMDSYIRNDKLVLAHAELERAAAGGISGDALRRMRTAVRFAERGGQFGPAHVAELRGQHEQYPDDAYTARVLGVGLIASGQPQEAETLLAKLAADDPQDEDARILLAVARQRLADFGGAAEALTLLVERYPNRRSLLADQARYLLFDFRLDESLAVYRRLAKQDAENADAWRSRVLEELLRSRRSVEALAELDAWMPQADPRLAESLAELRVRVLVAAGRGAEALEAARVKLEAAPEDPAARQTYVSIASLADAHEQIVERVKPWVATAGEDLLGWSQVLSEALVKLKRYDEALEAMREVTRRGTWTDSVAARLQMGRIHAAAGRPDTAVREYEALLEQQSLDADQRSLVRDQYMQILVRVGRFDDALAEVQRLAQDGVTPDFSLRLREAERAIFYQAGRMEEYLTLTEALHKAAPNDARLLNDLGYSWVDQSLHLEQATEMIRRAVAAEPLRPAYLDSLGWAYYKQGDFATARRWIERSVELASVQEELGFLGFILGAMEREDGVLLDHLGDVLWRLGEREAAADRWKRAVDVLRERLAENANATDEQALASAERKLAALAAGEAPAVAETLAEARVRGATQPAGKIE